MKLAEKPSSTAPPLPPPAALLFDSGGCSAGAQTERVTVIERAWGGGGGGRCPVSPEVAAPVKSCPIPSRLALKDRVSLPLSHTLCCVHTRVLVVVWCRALREHLIGCIRALHCSQSQVRSPCEMLREICKVETALILLAAVRLAWIAQ